MAFALPELPYGKDAFGDVLSAETFDYHYGKHHQAYITQANDQTKGTDLENASLLTVIAAAKAAGNKKLFNASAQIWNHSFYWLGLSPEKKQPSAALLAKIDADLGGLDAFKAAIKAESAGHFASGWGWLVLEGGKLKVTSYHDADTPSLTRALLRSSRSTSGSTPTTSIIAMRARTISTRCSTTSTGISSRPTSTVRAPRAPIRADFSALDQSDHQSRLGPFRSGAVLRLGPRFTIKGPENAAVGAWVFCARQKGLGGTDAVTELS
jgi:Fe-Mn family superoxide dismutase